MGLLDWFRSRSPASVESAPTFTVPEGHRLHFAGGTVEPDVSATPGGLMLANAGVGGDDQLEEIASLLAAVEIALRQPPNDIWLSEASGRLDALFTEEAPPCRRMARALVWFFRPGSLEGRLDDSDRLEILVRAFRRAADALGREERGLQVVCVEATTREARALQPLLASLRIEVRAAGDGGHVVATVERPAMTVTALLGHVLPPPAPGDWPTLQRDDPDAPASREANRRALARHIAARGPLGRSRSPLLRAPKLRTLVATHASLRTDETWAALCHELLAPRPPVLLIAARTATGETTCAPTSWPGLDAAFAAFPDLPALEAAASARGHATGSYAIAAMPPVELFVWASQLGLPVVLNGYRTPESPLYLLLPQEAVRTLAEGRVPARP